jgi:hypothetical protein
MHTGSPRSSAKSAPRVAEFEPRDQRGGMAGQHASGRVNETKSDNACRHQTGDVQTLTPGVRSEGKGPRSAYGSANRNTVGAPAMSLTQNGDGLPDITATYCFPAS